MHTSVSAAFSVWYRSDNNLQDCSWNMVIPITYPITGAILVYINWNSLMTYKFHVFKLFFTKYIWDMALLRSVKSHNIERVLGSKLAATSWIDIFIYLGTNTSHNSSQLTRKSPVPTDIYLYPYLQHQNVHIHVLVTRNHIICISNSHWTQYLGFVNNIYVLSKIQSNKATLYNYIEKLQKIVSWRKEIAIS